MQNQNKSIAELEEELLARGASFQISESMDADTRAAFLSHVLAVEDDEPTTTVREHLLARGKEVATELWPLIAQLAELNIVLERTDHLDDAALLDELNEFLEDRVNLIDDPRATIHLDLIGSGSDEDLAIMLRYYATAKERREWQRDFPDFDMPRHERLPFDRDRLLPTAEELRAATR
jgi:hypothetical protein